MGIADAFNPEDRVEVKTTVLYQMLRDAARAELIMNAVNCDVPYMFIREMVTGDKEPCPEAIVPLDVFTILDGEIDDGNREAAAQAMQSGGVKKELEKGLPKIKADADATDKKRPAAEKKSGRDRFDTGKMIALLEGGWDVAKIADEMKVSEATIYNHMKKEGIKLRK